MKKLFTFSLVTSLFAIFIFASVSCTRKYTCQCVMSYSGYPGLPDTTVRDYTIQNTKSKARDLCRGNSKVYQQGNIITHENCDLW